MSLRVLVIIFLPLLSATFGATETLKFLQSFAPDDTCPNLPDPRYPAYVDGLNVSLYTGSYIKLKCKYRNNTLFDDRLRLNSINFFKQYNGLASNEKNDRSYDYEKGVMYGMTSDSGWFWCTRNDTGERVSPYEIMTINYAFRAQDGVAIVNDLAWEHNGGVRANFSFDYDNNGTQELYIDQRYVGTFPLTTNFQRVFNKTTLLRGQWGREYYAEFLQHTVILVRNKTHYPVLYYHADTHVYGPDDYVTVLIEPEDFYKTTQLRGLDVRGNSFDLPYKKQWYGYRFKTDRDLRLVFYSVWDGAKSWSDKHWVNTYFPHFDTNAKNATPDVRLSLAGPSVPVHVGGYAELECQIRDAQGRLDPYRKSTGGYTFYTVDGKGQLVPLTSSSAGFKLFFHNVTQQDARLYVCSLQDLGQSQTYYLNVVHREDDEIMRVSGINIVPHKYLYRVGESVQIYFNGEISDLFFSRQYVKRSCESVGILHENRHGCFIPFLRTNFFIERVYKTNYESKYIAVQNSPVWTTSIYNTDIVPWAKENYKITLAPFDENFGPYEEDAEDVEYPACVDTKPHNQGLFPRGDGVSLGCRWKNGTNTSLLIEKTFSECTSDLCPIVYSLVSKESWRTSYVYQEDSTVAWCSDEHGRRVSRPQHFSVVQSNPLVIKNSHIQANGALRAQLFIPFKSWEGNSFKVYADQEPLGTVWILDVIDMVVNKTTLVGLEMYIYDHKKYLGMVTLNVNRLVDYPVLYYHPLHQVYGPGQVMHALKEPNDLLKTVYYKQIMNDDRIVAKVPCRTIRYGCWALLEGDARSVYYDVEADEVKYRHFFFTYVPFRDPVNNGKDEVVVIKGPSVPVHVGTDVILSCQIVTNKPKYPHKPTPAFFYNQKRKRYYRHDGTLVLHNVTLEDAGVYFCALNDTLTQSQVHPLLVVPREDTVPEFDRMTFISIIPMKKVYRKYEAVQIYCARIPNTTQAVVLSSTGGICGKEFGIVHKSKYGCLVFPVIDFKSFKCIYKRSDNHTSYNSTISHKSVEFITVDDSTPSWAWRESESQPDPALERQLLQRFKIKTHVIYERKIVVFDIFGVQIPKDDMLILVYLMILLLWMFVISAGKEKVKQN